MVAHNPNHLFIEVFAPLFSKSGKFSPSLFQKTGSFCLAFFKKREVFARLFFQKAEDYLLMLSLAPARASSSVGAVAIKPDG